jgi:hypothetical protein
MGYENRPGVTFEGNMANRDASNNVCATFNRNDENNIVHSIIGY